VPTTDLWCPQRTNEYPNVYVANPLKPTANGSASATTFGENDALICMTNKVLFFSKETGKYID